MTSPAMQAALEAVRRMMPPVNDNAEDDIVEFSRLLREAEERLHDR